MRRNTFDAIGDSRQRGVWRDQDMDVVGHDHKTMEGVLAESGFALAKRFDYVGSDDWISQPKRAGCSFVEGGVQDFEADARRSLLGGTDTLGCAGLAHDRGGEGIVKSPGQEDRAVFWMPMGEIAAIKGHDWYWVS